MTLATVISQDLAAPLPRPDEYGVVLSFQKSTTAGRNRSGRLNSSNARSWPKAVNGTTSAVEGIPSAFVVRAACGCPLLDRELGRCPDFNLMNLKADLLAQIITQLPHNRSDPTVVAELSGMSLPDLLIRYHNWLHRFVRPVPRSVHYSREFSSNALKSPHAPALADIADAIQKGRDLTPRLSKGIRHGYVVGSTSASSDKDLMLNDWGVHHLHLGINPDSKDTAFIERTGDLLFVIFRPTAAYVLNIFAHQTWTDLDIIRIAVNNWPRLDFFIELQGMMAPSGSGYTEAEHQSLRRAGVVVVANVDGRIFAGRGALSTAGTSIEAKRAAGDLLKRVTAFEELSSNKPDQIAALLKKADVTPPATPEFEFVLLDLGYGVREKTTGAVIILSD